MSAASCWGVGLSVHSWSPHIEVKTCCSEESADICSRWTFQNCCVPYTQTYFLQLITAVTTKRLKVQTQLKSFQINGRKWIETAGRALECTAGVGSVYSFMFWHKVFLPPLILEARRPAETDADASGRQRERSLLPRKCPHGNPQQQNQHPGGCC